MTELSPIDDVVGPNLRLLLVGINPGRRSSEVGAHFAGPGNRFWPALAAAGITDRVLRPDEQWELTAVGVGITNLVARPSPRAADLTPEELRAGGRTLIRNLASWEPRVVAILGLTAFRTAFAAPGAQAGRQSFDLAEAALWLLPNPSGLNAATSLAVHAEGLRTAARHAGVALHRSSPARG